MSEEKFQALYKNTKKEEIIKELYFKCKANYKLESIIKEVREYLEIFTSFDECTINGRMLQKAIDILDKENKDDKV